MALLGSRAPDPIRVGDGTCVLVEGMSTAPGQEVEGMRIRVGKSERDVDAYLPADGSWWALAPLAASTRRGGTPIVLTVRAGGEDVELPLGELVVAEEASGCDARPRPAVGGGESPLIGICMATHEPRPERLRRQLDSIRAQSWSPWHCVISDDASSPEAFAALEREVAGDPQFSVSRSEERLGFLRNFERAISMAPPEAGLLALADQDDRWHPDKLEALAATLDAFPEAQLVYSDVRILDGDGNVLSDTYWYLRRNRCTDIASLMIANVVTGAASLFRRSLLDDALPFPPAHPAHAIYHDHWLALCALAVGEVAYLDRPTHDYFRHDDSVTVREAPRWLRPESGFAGRVRLHWGRLTRRLRMGSVRPPWEEIYRTRWLMIRQLTTILEMRLGERMLPRHRRSLRRLVGAEHSPLGAAWLAARCLMPLIGRNETLARERVLLGGLGWRWRQRLERRPR